MKRAFTLIELSIVLIIIGLLVGGVLAGRDLIQQARLSALVREVEQYKVADRTFQLKYGCRAGDCDNAASFGIGANGDGNGRVEDEAAEIPAYWDHLANAGVIEGAFDGGYSPPLIIDDEAPGTELGGESVYWFYYITSANNDWGTGTDTLYGLGGHGYGISGLDTALGGAGRPRGGVVTAAQALSIDTKMDDGGASSGKVVAVRPYGSSGWINDVCLGGAVDGGLITAAAGTYDYNLTETEANCRLMVGE